MTSRRKIALLLSLMVVLAAGAAFADWREWLPWPQLLHHSYTKFDRFEIYGNAPWCFLSDPGTTSVDCHYLSKNQCQLANVPAVNAANPEDRGVCVANGAGNAFLSLSQANWITILVALIALTGVAISQLNARYVLRKQLHHDATQRDLERRM